jgi:hypothetical protein
MKDFGLRTINQPLEIPMKDQPASEPRILKISTCASLSGRASVTYHLGYRGESEVCFRIWDTSGKGIFSKEWVCASEIQKVLAQNDSIAALTLLPMFKVGRSVNTAGFLLAALRNEGLVQLSPEVAHRYLPIASKSFMEEVQALIKANTNLDAGAVPAIKKARKGSRRRQPRGHPKPHPSNPCSSPLSRRTRNGLRRLPGPRS